MGPVTNFIKGQVIKWLGHIMQIDNNETLRIAMEWKSQGKRSREKPRKKLIENKWFNVELNNQVLL